MKTVLGLDLGTNSIGWALIEQQFDEKLGEINGMPPITYSTMATPFCGQ